MIENPVAGTAIMPRRPRARPLKTRLRSLPGPVKLRSPLAGSTMVR